MGTVRTAALMVADKGNQFWDSKTRIPEAAHSLIERTRLVEELSASGAQVSVFNTGAGFGKTILMAELARKYDGQYVWYQVDGTDNDPICFLQGLMPVYPNFRIPFTCRLDGFGDRRNFTVPFWHWQNGCHGQ